jgi:AraC-like DNA-binding protein
LFQADEGLVVGNQNKTGPAGAISLSESIANLARVIANALDDSEKRTVSSLDLELYRVTAPTAPTSCSYEPSLLVVAQGAKRVDLGKATYSFGEATFLLTSLELPVVSQVIGASEESPYLAFFLKLDIPTVRDILNTDEVEVPETAAGTRGMAIGASTVDLIESCSRLVNLLSSPKDMPFMGKLLRREITYRLLQSSQGGRLRAIATPGNQDNRSAKVVDWLRRNYAKPLNIDALADLAGMGRSTLHHHFRALTAMSPLQFQKQLRLHAARQRMLTDEVDATSAAFEVGYESASQFNREYRRFFGNPPMRDIQTLRMTN